MQAFYVTSALAAPARSRIGTDAPFIANTDAMYNACMRHCAAYSVYDVELQTCEYTCAKMRRQSPLLDKKYSSYEKCAKDLDTLDLNRDILLEKEQSWCQENWTHIHKRQGCKEAIFAFLQAATIQNVCSRYPAPIAPPASENPLTQSTPEVQQAPLSSSGAFSPAQETQKKHFEQDAEALFILGPTLVDTPKYQRQPRKPRGKAETQKQTTQPVTQQPEKTVTSEETGPQPQSPVTSSTKESADKKDAPGHAPLQPAPQTQAQDKAVHNATQTPAGDAPGLAGQVNATKEHTTPMLQGLPARPAAREPSVQPPPESAKPFGEQVPATTKEQPAAKEHVLQEPPERAKPFEEQVPATIKEQPAAKEHVLQEPPERAKPFGEQVPATTKEQPVVHSDIPKPPVFSISRPSQNATAGEQKALPVPTMLKGAEKLPSVEYSRPE